MKIASRVWLLASALVWSAAVQAQVPMSSGPYFQNFNSLAASGIPPWTDNTTLPGWYAQFVPGGVPTAVTAYRAETGTGNAGALYSFGTNGVQPITDRALGSVASGTTSNLAFGLRLLNNTLTPMGIINISYTGEQWRNGSNTSPNSVRFSYRVSNTPITSPDAAGLLSWTGVSTLDFTSPIFGLGVPASALDGNAPPNRAARSGVLSVSVPPGGEIFLRWLDQNDPGNDPGLAVDDLSVSFQPLQPIALTCASNITVTATGPGGAVVTYTSSATGGCSPPPTVVCSPPSGSTFPVGTTLVSCTATDLCGGSASCSFTVKVDPSPCLEPDNGTGTVTLPPQGCPYLSPDDVHRIIDGLPPGTTIELSAIHRDFICKQGTSPCTNDCFTTDDCDPTNGATEAFDSTLELHLHGTGALAGWDRNLVIPNVSCQSQVGPRTPGQPVQDFDTEMLAIQGQLPTGDPDFDLLRITAGSLFGLPSPGHTTLTRQPGGNWAVDSFFDIAYRIDFVGHPGGALAGQSGSTTGTIRMRTGHPQPNPLPIEVDHFPATTAQIQLQLPGGGTEVVNLAGPSTVHVTINPDGTGASDTDGDGRDQVQTEMVDLSLTGNSSLGPVSVSLDPAHPTYGEIEETANLVPGRLDLPPFAPTGTADSFFDVFVELQVGGQTLHPATPLHMAGVIRHKPPAPGDEYINPFTQPVPLLDANGNPTGLYVLQEVHTPNPTNPPPIEIDHFPNTTAQIQLQLPSGGTEVVNLAGPSTVQVMINPDGTGALDTDGDGRDQVQTEMTDLSLTGNSSLGPVSVSLDPAHPTYGEIEEISNSVPGRLDLPPFAPNGTADSFFDVFVELQVGGQTLHPATPLHMAGVIRHKPPAPGDEYVNPFTQPVPLLDANGNPTGLYVLQEVHTPNPTNPPLAISCSSNIVVGATGAAGAQVFFSPPTVSGGCSPVTASCTPASGSIFPIGTTTVQCTATDACNNTATCIFTVTVTRPTITIIKGTNGQIQLEWSGGTLQEADKVEGPYIDMDPPPTSPLILTPAEGKKFFRVRAGQPGFTFFDTELLQLDISGGDLPLGMRLRESPTRASLGKTAMSPGPAGGFVIHSFFDVFTEISVDNGASWSPSTGAPPRMTFTGTAPVNTLPPKDAEYVSPGDWHAQYALGIYITNASHLGFTASYPPPPPGGSNDIHSFGSTVNMLVRPCPTCPYQAVSAPAGVTVQVRSRP